jgi:hypothetical protein
MARIFLSGAGEFRELPGRPIPYHLTAAEASAFIDRYSGYPGLAVYLSERVPVYGMIVHPDPPAIGDFLVWIDAAGVLHVVDVTMMPIARAVEQPEYVSPGATATDLLADVKNFVDTLLGSMKWLGVAAVAVLALYLVSTFRPSRP